MKRIFLIPLFFAVILCSCKKERIEAIEVEKVYKKPDELLQQFVSALDQGARSWAAVLNPKSGKSYSMYFTMDRAGNVITLVDLDVNTARQPKLGTYHLNKGATNASISFSGTYLDDITHKKGFRTLSADTSYSFKYMKGDTLVLLGNTYGDELKMITLTANKVTEYEQGVLGNSYIYLNNFFSKKPYFSVTLPGNIALQVGINAGNRSLNLVYVKDGKLVIHSTDYAYGLNTVILKSPVQIGQLLITELLIDTSTGTFYMANGNNILPFVGSSMPVLPLHLLIGRDFPPVISLPSPTFVEELPGWSPDFLNIWLSSSTDMLNSIYNSELLVMAFNLDTKNELMNLDMLFTSDNKVFKATFPLKYTKTTDGTYKFTALPLDLGIDEQKNANAILPYVLPLLEMVVNDAFDIDYYENGNVLMAQMTSKTRPEIYFTGYMASYQ